MKEFKKNVDREQTRKQDFSFLYPLFFQEYIYALTHNRSFNRSSLFENVGYDKKVRLLIVKRLITGMYHQNSFLISTYQNAFFGHNKHFYLQIISSKLAVIVEMKLFLGLVSSIEDNKIDESKNLRSIHSIFPFLEDKFSCFNYVSNILIPYPAHLEILVLILRCWVKDASSLHFLRFVLHENRNWNHFFFQKNIFPPFQKEKKNQRLFVFLYNSYVCEYESIFVFLRNQSYHLRSTFFGTFFERTIFYGKIKKEYLVNVFTKDFQAISCMFKDIFIHYVRYQGKSILASKCTFFIQNKWNYYFALFWKCRFYVWYQSERIKTLSKHFLAFLGYLSSANIRFNPSLGRSQMIENSFLINNISKTFDTTVPITPLVGPLVKAKVGDVLSYPISKLISSDLSDYDIIDLFWHICRNLSHYYSGASKKSSLYQIKYILRLSCTRTLARKHKSALRAFLKRLGQKVLEEFFMEEEQVLLLIFSRYSFTSKRLYRKGRFWYLDIYYLYQRSSQS
uniref:Maturase K n=1 Tax=Amyema miraculosa TaxID=3078780 RepID=A0AA96LYM1_9MAGN|nr:maturase K [Amyema miraculosa]WNR57898.1 maturase K [Amyema miraculosa]